MKRLEFVDGSVRTIFHAVLVGSLWLLFAGHDQPGGGFVGGLVAGAAIALRYVAGGIDEVRSIGRFKPWTILGGGLLVSAGTAIAPALVGRPVLTAMSTTWPVPGVGDLHPSTTLVFDVGVYLLVVGLVLMVLEAFGEDDVRPGSEG